MPDSPDFYGSLLPVLGMQVMLNLPPMVGAIWMVLCIPVMILMMRESYGLPQAVALSLIYSAGNAFFGTYTLAMRRAQSTHQKNQSLVQEIQQANLQLESYSHQLERLTIEQERNRLARELHDTVSQLIFSISLTTRSTQLLLEKDPARAAAELHKLQAMSGDALSQLRSLITQLRPAKNSQGHNHT